jgi:hypothetical protein
MSSSLSLPKHVDHSRQATAITSLVSLLPLWLVSLAITVEGFPRPPVSLPVAYGALVLALVISFAALLKGWMTLELFLVSFFPLALLRVFDEISTAYKTPFILLCALAMTAGILLYWRSRPSLWRWLILLAALATTWLLAQHLTLNYWQMAADLGYVRCLPDAAGCPPLAGRGMVWWRLVFM